MSTEEFDINKVIVEFLDRRLDSLAEAGKGVLNYASNRVRLALRKTYEVYLRVLLEKYSRTKSFFIRTEPVSLYSFYVPLAIGSGDSFVPSPGYQDIEKLSRLAIITGLGGSGKSMFLRHLLLDAVATAQRVPILVELREAERPNRCVVELVRDSLRRNKFKRDDDFIQRALAAGHFCLLFDGFDELSQVGRRAISRDLQQFVETYDRVPVVVTSRPDPELEGWPGFRLVQLQPLTLDAACSLVDRLPFDGEMKALFLRDLRDGLFERHVSLLSNPLLLSIMLPTHGQSGDIPKKLTIFYNQAFEALFERHDILKSGAFKRERRTDLDIQDFARIFSAFCLVTFDARQFRFSRTEALRRVEEASRLVSIACDEGAFLDDAMQSVCLLVQDGLVLEFAHRSFQEYFAARFISEARPQVQKKLIQRFAETVGRDQLMSMLFEMRPETVEEHYVLPGLTKLLESIGVDGQPTREDHLRFLKLCYKKIRISRGLGVMASIATSGMVITKALRFSLVSYRDVAPPSPQPSGGSPLVEKYAPHGSERSFPTASMKLDDEIVEDLARRGRFFSLETLERASKIKRFLEEKLKRSDESLEEILKGSN